MLTQTEQKYVKDVYENIAERFNHTRAYKWKWVDRFFENLNKNSLVYDVGCGSGRNMNYHGLKFIGIDNCDNFIKICKSKNLDVINANVTSIPLESNTADAIICIAMFHQLSFDKYGDNIVSWNNYGTIYERYYYIFKIDEIKDLFEKTNLILLNHFYDCGNEIFILKK
jgi:SAM-dependent methyltransferase